MKASEIVFRGKRVDNGEMVEGYYYQTQRFVAGHSCQDIIIILTEECEEFQVHPDSIETVQKLYTQEEVNQLLQKQKVLCARLLPDSLTPRGQRELLRNIKLIANAPLATEAEK